MFDKISRNNRTEQETLSGEGKTVPGIIQKVFPFSSDVHYRNSKSPPPVPVLSQTSPVYGSLRPVLTLPFHLQLGLQNGLFLSVIPQHVPHAPPKLFQYGDEYEL